MMLLKAMQKDVCLLKERYNKLSSLQAECFPKNLAKILDNLGDKLPENTSLLSIYRAFAAVYLSRSWFMGRRVNPCLNAFSEAGRFYPGYISKKKPSPLVGTTDLLMDAYQANLFEGDLAPATFDAIALNDGSPEWIINVLKVLKKANLLTRDNIDRLTEYMQAMEFVTALEVLHAKKLLMGSHAQANFCALLTLSENTKALSELIQKDRITQKEFNELITSYQKKSGSNDISEDVAVMPTISLR